MSHVNFDHSTPLIRPFGFMQDLVRRLKHRRELNALLSMPDYQLKDVGLQRGDVLRESLKPIWRA